MFIKHISVIQARQITFSGYIEQGCNFSYIFKFNQTLQSTSIQLFFPLKINVASCKSQNWHTIQFVELYC